MWSHHQLPSSDQIGSESAIQGRLRPSCPNWRMGFEVAFFTEQEIAEGLADGPFTREDLDSRFGPGQSMSRLVVRSVP